VATADDDKTLERKAQACEVDLEEARGLATAREKLLLANISELNSVYDSLREKMRELRERDTRIRDLDELMTRANRLSSLGELAASIAHEIKNPLISIEGFAKRIVNTEDMDNIRRYAGYIEKESERLSTVLIRLLDFSRMMEPNREFLDLNAIVEDTILFTEHHLTRFRNVTLTVEEAEGLPKIFADRVHVQQALINIMMNAAQSMPEGGPIVIRTGSAGDEHAWISVSDEGGGMDEDQLSHIFEPFFTTKPRGEGTGLGLSLTKKLIEANRGRIEVESIPGKGSTFRLLIPVKAEPDAPSTAE
jgi:two-component system, NtrC family, sensor histidine kinase HydH